MYLTITLVDVAVTVNSAGSLLIGVEPGPLGPTDAMTGEPITADAPVKVKVVGLPAIGSKTHSTLARERAVVEVRAFVILVPVVLLVIRMVALVVEVAVIVRETTSPT